jgi:hypothetical protein
MKRSHKLKRERELGRDWKYRLYGTNVVKRGIPLGSSAQCGHWWGETSKRRRIAEEEEIQRCREGKETV